jgi:cellulose biosynthesis protein BcsQ
MAGTTTALVGTVGGAGTTRTTVELAAALAADGRSVAVVDASFATQGLSRYLRGALDPDVTALVTDAADAPLGAGLVDLDVGVPGRVACLPADAPFERLARAKAPAAAERFGDRIRAAATEFDAVLVDTPPVAANQAVAAVTAVDRVAVVAPATDRGTDGVQRTRARLADVGAGTDAVIATFGELPGADAALPETEAEGVPACLGGDEPFAEAVAAAAAAATGVSLTVSFGDDGLLGAVGDLRD